MTGHDDYGRAVLAGMAVVALCAALVAGGIGWWLGHRAGAASIETATCEIILTDHGVTTANATAVCADPDLRAWINRSGDVTVMVPPQVLDRTDP